MLFVINRCDELGVDPLDSVAEFFNRRDRKCAELLAALESRAIHVSRSHVHGVAADPFGGMGATLAVTAANYDANRSWDGIAALADALRAWADNDLSHAGTLVTFDGALTHVLALRESTGADIEVYRAETGKHDSLIASMDICLEDAKYLRQSLEHELADTLAGPAAQAISRIRNTDTGDELGLAEALVSWRTPETQSELERFMRIATDKVNDWSATHLSAISREESAAGFDANLDLPGAPSVGAAADAVVRAAGLVGWAAKLGKQLGNAKVLGNREAALKIGHLFGHKFKPWGAIKAGKAVGRVGAVLGVVAVAADALAWMNQANKMADWDSKRDAAVEEVESGIRQFQQETIDEPDGPWRYLGERTDEVRSLRELYLERRQAALRETERLQQRLEMADELVNLATEMRQGGAR